MTEIYNKEQQSLAKKMEKNASLEKWTDWKWQISHSIKSIDAFEKITGITFNKEKRKELEKTVNKFPLSITPYYLSLIDTKDYEWDPVFKQSFPDPAELQLQKSDIKDPLAEDEDSPVQGITHRYPDRLLFLISNTCSMYCRHCTRKRRVGDTDSIPSKKEVMKGIDYIKQNPQVRDVLLSGGDPFLLSTDYLDWILTQLDDIDHVEVVRIGTRTPAVLPYRITNKLVSMLQKHHPLWVNTHFNHPRELTTSAKRSLSKLSDAGIPLGNQSVLLAGVNDCPRIMKSLVQKLVANRVRPYYLYQCDLSEGLTHFRTPISKGIEIMENLIGHTSGFAVPRYVIDAPGGGGKIPVMPQYLISWGTNKVILRNYEGVITSYKEPDSYKQYFCDRNCEECELQLKLEGAEEKAVGIAKLLADYDKSISLTPENTERLQRRKKD